MTPKCFGYFASNSILLTDLCYTLVADTWIAASQIPKEKDAAKEACEANGAKLLEIWSENEWNEVSS